MRPMSFTISVAGLATAAALGAAAPASAEPRPEVTDPNASCVGQVFAPQAVHLEPGAIAARIAEIKGFIPVSFGAVIGDFARWPDCSPE
ncbi:hypothetical protein ASG88_09410 [Nocardioides sp. Soil777]|uniref:hypothetical protein n=1 Tax=Nocardioides sp. Soil777 TaxID=1736409 RepID=UPI000703B3B3|nr:hypothetical protein [Nocardioides sp. Soil777]KRF00667.1 hypothetical protein ASG88_09410 [Nocardioides sp. Soil777]